MFKAESIIVKTWVTLVKSGQYTRERVPKIGDLQEVVFGILDIAI